MKALFEKLWGWLQSIITTASNIGLTIGEWFTWALNSLKQWPIVISSFIATVVAGWFAVVRIFNAVIVIVIQQWHVLESHLDSRDSWGGVGGGVGSDALGFVAYVIDVNVVLAAFAVIAASWTAAILLRLFMQLAKMIRG